MTREVVPQLCTEWLTWGTVQASIQSQGPGYWVIVSHAHMSGFFQSEHRLRTLSQPHTLHDPR